MHRVVPLYILPLLEIILLLSRHCLRDVLEQILQIISAEELYTRQFCQGTRLVHNFS